MEQILENLKSIYSQLQAKLAKADERVKEEDTRQKKTEETDRILTTKAEDLNQRESKVKHIESIEEATQKAKELIVEAKKANDELDKRQEDHQAEVSKFGKEKVELQKEVAAGKESNKKQAEALKQERKDFEAEKKAFQTIKAVIK